MEGISPPPDFSAVFQFIFFSCFSLSNLDLIQQIAVKYSTLIVRRIAFTTERLRRKEQLLLTFSKLH